MVLTLPSQNAMPSRQLELLYATAVFGANEQQSRSARIDTTIVYVFLT